MATIGRVSMHTKSENISYISFDGYVNYKPTKGLFSVYLTETKESTEVSEIKGALITRRNVALASSVDDKPVTSGDFDSFNEKLYFRETVKGGKLVAKEVTYAEAKDAQHKYFASNSYRLGSSYYLVTEKGAVLKLILTWTTRQKVNEQLDDMGEIDFLTISASKDTVTVWTGSRSQEVYELSAVNSTKEYTRKAVDKINETVNKLQEILEYKKSGKSTDEWVTAEDANKVFEDKEESNDLPI